MSAADWWVLGTALYLAVGMAVCWWHAMAMMQAMAEDLMEEPTWYEWVAFVVGGAILWPYLVILRFLEWLKS